MLDQAEQWQWEATRDEEEHEAWLNEEEEADPDLAYDQWVEDNLLDA